MAEAKMALNETDNPLFPYPPSPQLASASSWRLLAEVTLSSQTGNGCLTQQEVAEAVQSLRLPAAQRERLEAAVAEAAFNALEHNNRYQPEAQVLIRVLTSGEAIPLRLTKQGPAQPAAVPSPAGLSSKEAGQLLLQGWSFFLIERTATDLTATTGMAHHLIELFLYLEGS